MILQIIRGCLVGIVVVIILRAVKRRIVGGQTALHFPNNLWLYTQITGNGVHLIVAQPSQTLLLAAQVEEQLALGLVVATLTIRQLRRMNS